MKKALLLRVEYYEKGPDQAPRATVWNILPEYVVQNIVGDALRIEQMIRSYVTTEGDPVATRVPYFDYDGSLRARDPQAWTEYDGVRHFDNRVEA